MSIMESRSLGHDRYLLLSLLEKSTRHNFLVLLQAPIGSYKRSNVTGTERGPINVQFSSQVL